MLTALGNTKLARILRKIHQRRLHDKDAKISEEEITELLSELHFEFSIAKTRMEQLEECMTYIRKELKR